MHYGVRYSALMDEHTDATSEQMALEVRRRRQQRNWTLDTAATRLGVSRRLLAQVEAGQANPSLSTLLAIAAGFDISLVELLSGADKPAVTVQADNATAPVLWTGDHGGEARLLVGSEPLELWAWTLRPGDERSTDAHRTGSREALLVTAGVVTLVVGATDPVTLRVGQSALFRADEPHSYRNDSRKPASFVLAVHEPSGVTA
jgi:transcriptional regulator with XRE-family HTH domain